MTMIHRMTGMHESLALLLAAGLASTAVATLPQPQTFNDPVEGFAEFGGTWTPVNETKPGYFTADDDGLLAEQGSTFYVSRFNGGTFVGISRVFDGTFQAYTVVNAVYDVAALFGDLFGFPEGSPQFLLFADLNANGVWDPGEQIPALRTSRPTPPDGEFTGWSDETFIGPATTTAGGDPVVGEPIGYVFRAAQPESTPPDMIYAWAVDDLTLFVRPAILDDVDNDGAWVNQNDPNGFWAAADFANDGLDPIAGEQSFNLRFNGDFNGIEKLFDGLVFEAGTTYEASFFMGDPVNSEFGLLVPNSVPGGDQDRSQMQLFADINGNGTYDNGELIPPVDVPFFPDQYSPVPTDEWLEWNDRWVITAGSTTFAGDPIVGAPVGWMFRGKTPPNGNPPIYGWAVDDLRLDLGTVSEADSVVLAAWHTPDDAAVGFDLGDKVNDDTPDIADPRVSAQVGSPNGGWEVRAPTNSNDGTFGNLLSPAAPTGSNGMFLRTNSDAQRRLDFSITNNAELPLRLDRVHFDYARLFEGGPKFLSLFMRTAAGNLDLQGFPVVFSTDNTFILGTGGGDYADVDADLAQLTDRVLDPGETAAFRFQVTDADGAFSGLVIDNLAITGAFLEPACLPDLNGDGVLDLFDILVFFGAFGEGSDLADLDGSGTLDLFDILTFFDLFGVGC